MRNWYSHSNYNMLKGVKGMLPQQLSFQLPEIDREATRKRVEQALETARVYKQIGFIPKEINSTSSYEPRYHGSTNAINKSTEDVSAWNIDTEERMRQTVERVEAAINRLGKREKEIILLRYMQMESSMDYIVCDDLHMSERQYRRIKANAFYKLAFILKLAVMLDDTERGA